VRVCVFRRAAGTGLWGVGGRGTRTTHIHRLSIIFAGLSLKEASLKEEEGWRFFWRLAYNPVLDIGRIFLLASSSVTYSADKIFLLSRLKRV
jgi:hypothetical protein